MYQHRTILFSKDIFADFYYIVGTDAEEVFIEGSMVEFTERNSVADFGYSFGETVCDDVCGIEQLVVPELAACTLLCGMHEVLSHETLVDEAADEQTMLYKHDVFQHRYPRYIQLNRSNLFLNMHYRLLRL
jgi:hypothetical protein